MMNSKNKSIPPAMSVTYPGGVGNAQANSEQLATPGVAVRSL